MGRLKNTFGDEEVAKAAMRIIDPSFDRLRLWRWISGVAMSRQDLDDLGQTQDLTSAEAARLAEILCMLGRLLKEIRGETLVLVLDEMERLKAIGLETIPTFVSGFTRLLDPNQATVSVLVGTSAAVESELIEVFAESGPVTSRLGSRGQDRDPFVTRSGCRAVHQGRDRVLARVRHRPQCAHWPSCGHDDRAHLARLLPLHGPRRSSR